MTDEKRFVRRVFTYIAMDVAYDDMGVYCAAVIRDGVKTERTEWQNGWNAYGSKLREKQKEIYRWLNEMAIEDADAIVELLISDTVNVRVREGKVGVEVNCNDLFYWGAGDAEDIEISELSELRKAMRESEEHGASLWCCRKRGMRPQRPYYKMFTEAERALFDACGPERDPKDEG